MQVECGHCQKRYSIADENAGKQFLCRACGKKSPVVPIGSAAPAAGAARTAAAANGGAATLTVACPKCGKEYQNVPASAVGKQFKCKVCQQISPIRAPVKKASKPAASSSAAVRKDAAAKNGAPVRPAAKPAAARAVAMAAAPAAATSAPGLPPASDPLAQDVFGGSPNLLDMLGEAPLPGSTGTPLAGPLLAKPLPAAAPPKKLKAKKKKKSKGDSAASDHVTVMLRMMGGGCLVLCGLGLIVWGIVIIANPDDSGLHVMRAIRRFVGGVSLIGGGLKSIVG